MDLFVMYTYNTVSKLYGFSVVKKTIFEKKFGLLVYLINGKLISYYIDN